MTPEERDTTWLAIEDVMARLRRGVETRNLRALNEAWAHAGQRMPVLIRQLNVNDEPIQAVRAYCAKHGVWSEYPGHARQDWQYEVGNGDTVLGYWAWVEHQVEAAAEDGG